MKKPKKNNFISKLESFLIFSIPVAVFLSYYPIIRLGATDSMNLELSVPLIVLAVLGILSFRWIPKIWKSLGAKKFLISAIIPFYICLSILWSPNKLRAILVSGIVCLIWLVALNILFGRKLKIAELQKIIYIYLGSAAVFSLICIFQCIADVLGVDRNYTLLCQGCTYMTFGFPHPNGFAIEPQFMGNLLLGPCIISLIIFFYNIKNRKRKSEILPYLLLSAFLMITLYIVFSRGAIYSFVLAAAGIFFYELFRKPNIVVFTLPLLVACSFGTGLLFQGFLAAASPTSEGFYEGVARSVNQISLGIIDFRPKALVGENESIFDGYIEESTDIRMSLSEAAFTAWKQNPIFGVGIGGAGMAIHEIDNSYSSKEIVQNQYMSILLELGVVGILLIGGGVIYLCVYIIKKKSVVNCAITGSYLVSLFFFAGLPNALHIYLLTPMLAPSRDKYFMVKYENE